MRNELGINRRVISDKLNHIQPSYEKLSENFCMRKNAGTDPEGPLQRRGAGTGGSGGNWSSCFSGRGQEYSFCQMVFFDKDGSGTILEYSKVHSCHQSVITLLKLVKVI